MKNVNIHPLKIAAFLLVLISLTSCKKYKNQIELLNVSKDSIQSIADNRNDQIMDYIVSFNDIQQNLDSIKRIQKVLDISLSEGNVENQRSQKDQILNDIAILNNLLNQNKSLIASLRKKLKDNDLKNKELEELIQSYVLQVQEKDTEIAELNNQLGKLKIDISNLNQRIDELAAESVEKTNTIEGQKDQMNEAFYCFGTKDELIANKVVEKSGGFLGMGKSVRIMADFNHDYFTKVDQRNFTEIILMSKKATLLSVHPETSYRFITNEEEIIEKLIIDQPAEFWKASIYLIVIVEQ